MTQTQREIIGLAEMADALVEQELRNQQQRSANSSVNTKSGLENRKSKRERIEKAKRQAKMN